MKKAAEQAREYLKRVIDEHPGTPWSAMAEKELGMDLGWTWVEERKPVPGAEGQNLTREEEARLLLADDMQQRETRRRQMEKPRDKPKL
jgi:hypothetical protein